MNSDAHVYGLSMFSLACDEGSEKEILDELKTAAALFKENAGYSSLLDSPAVSLDERLSLIDTAFSGAHMYVLNFLKILCEKRYTHLFIECVKEYEKAYEKKNNITRITAITARALSDDQRTRLIKKLENEYGKKVILSETVDKSIIGGIVIKGENSQTDASVLSRLNALRSSLK